MDLHVYVAFFMATVVLIALPGPSVLLTVSHSISFGWRAALVTVAGATAGVAVQLVVAAIGLASLLGTVAEAFNWLRWAGAAYLVYLGIKQWKSASVPVALDTRETSRAHLFVQGLVVTIFNPKSLIFIAAFLPQFIDTTRPLGRQFMSIVPTFLIITFVVTSLWALISGKAREFLRGQRAFRNVMRGSGALIIMAGLGLAVARKSQ